MRILAGAPFSHLLYRLSEWRQPVPIGSQNYVFNHIDATWYDDQLKTRLNRHIETQFLSGDRTYKTSGLLEFYGSLIGKKNGGDRWGLDSTTMEKTPRIPFPPAVRKYVYDRDRYTCQSCGKTGEETRLTIDHIIALARGGTNDLSNLQTLCWACNRRKLHYRDRRFNRRFTNQ